MKMKGVLALVLVLAVFLSGFSLDYDDEGVRTAVTGAVDALVAGDFMAFRVHVSDQVDNEELNVFFKQMSGVLNEAGSYELKAVNKKVGIRDGVNYVAVLYEMTAGDAVYEVEAVIIEGHSGLSSLRMDRTDAEPAPEVAPAGAANWVFTGLGIVTVAFTLWMAVDCIRRHMKRKWLWLALILLISLMLSFSLLNGKLSFQFYAGLYVGLTNLKVYVDRGFAATIYLPLGALIYFFRRKKLTLPEEERGMTGPEIEG